MEFDVKGGKPDPWGEHRRIVQGVGAEKRAFLCRVKRGKSVGRAQWHWSVMHAREEKG